MSTLSRVVVFALLVIVALTMVGCGSRTPRNAEGGIDGEVTRVGRDNMSMDVDGGNNIRIDTWGVCGDATNQNINVGDRVQVFASRDLFSYDAWRILDESGEPACPTQQRR